MDLLLILTYTAICIAIFKVFNIPLNKWTVPTAVLGGVVLIGTLILLMNYNHPFTQIGSQVYSTTPIVSGVRGRVIDVPVEPNKPLKQGGVLFTIDPIPYQAEVAKIRAQIKEASQGAFTEQQLDTRRQAYKAAESSVNVATAKVELAQLALDSEIGGENTTVARLLEELRQAEFDLEQTVVRAPTDGFATQLALSPGVMAVPLPLAPVMTFVQSATR